VLAALVGACSKGAVWWRHEVAEAAETGKAKPRTVKQWLTLPTFNRRIDQLRAEMTARALGVLADSAARAASTLASLSLTASSAPAPIAAAKAVLGELERLIAELRPQCALTPQLPLHKQFADAVAHLGHALAQAVSVLGDHGLLFRGEWWCGWCGNWI
jgi:hypothetical protein